jgi:drug/metabolite transporter (DMT)-like permease
VALGLCGLALLANPSGAGRIDPVGLVVLVLASLSWSAGTVLSRRAQLPSSPFVATALEALCGGALLLVVAAFTGQMSAFSPAAVTTRSLVALAYLVVFGSLVAFTAFVWLLRVVAPTRVATYAYVNPVIAILLGWLFAGEPLTARALLAMGVIVGAVVLITTEKREAGAPESPRHAPDVASGATQNEA